MPETIGLATPRAAASCAWKLAGEMMVALIRSGALSREDALAILRSGVAEGQRVALDVPALGRDIEALFTALSEAVFPGALPGKSSH
jgi:hypothetical protein